MHYKKLMVPTSGKTCVDFSAEYSNGIPLKCFAMSEKHSSLTFLCFFLYHSPL